MSFIYHLSLSAICYPEFHRQTPCAHNHNGGKGRRVNKGEMRVKKR